MSTDTTFSNLQVETKPGYAIITLDRGRANPINAGMISDLRAVLKGTAEDDSVQGMILAGKENFFSAGLDLIEMYDYDELTLLQFWKNFMAVIHELAAWPKPMIAAVTGHAPAGGCIFAMGADWRVMAEGKYKIGLNEVPVGIIVPPHIQDLYEFWIGQQRAYQFLLEGKMVSPEVAQEIGLVNHVVSPEEVIPTAEKKLKQYLGYHPQVWRLTKANLRRRVLKSMEDFDFDAIFQPALDMWWEPNNRAMMKMMVEGLKSKKG